MLDFWKRKLNFHEPEVVRASIASALFFITLLLVNFYDVFLCNIAELRSLMLGLTGGLLSLFGFSITGIAIVISLFNTRDINFIEELQSGSYVEILDTFKNFAYDMAINIILFILVYILMLTNCPAPGRFLFYVLVAALLYLFFYILFYGWALLCNCTALSNIKKVSTESQEEAKSKFDTLNEIGLEQLVEIIYQGSQQNSKSFYRTLLKAVKNSNLTQKDELSEYIVRRYLNG